MRAVLNVSLPQELYSEIGDAVSCHEYENKSQLVQTLISQWSDARRRHLHQIESRQQKVLRFKTTVKHLVQLLALGVKNVNSDLSQTAKLIGFFFITIGRDFRHTIVLILQLISRSSSSLQHKIDKKTTDDDQVLYTRRSTHPPTC